MEGGRALWALQSYRWQPKALSKSIGNNLSTDIYIYIYMYAYVYINTYARTLLLNRGTWALRDGYNQQDPTQALETQAVELGGGSNPAALIPILRHIYIYIHI